MNQRISYSTGYIRKSGVPYSNDPVFVSQTPPFSSVTPYSVMSLRETKSSVNSPNFPRNKPQNAFSVYREEFDTSSPLSYKGVPFFRYPYYITQLDSSCFSVINPTATLLPYDPTSYNLSDDALLAKLRKKVLDSKINLAVFAAETRTTGEMILETARKISKAYSSVRKGRLADAAAVLKVRPLKKRFKDPADNWLAYSYGWIPLLSDAKGAAEELARRSLAKKYSQSVSVSLRSEQRAFRHDLSVNGVIGFPSAVNTVARFDRSSSSFARVDFFVTNEALRERAQVGFIDPLLVAWEVVPLSFVIDWFLPIADFLESRNAFSGVEVQKCFINRRSTMVLTGNLVAPGFGIWTEKTFSFNRSIVTDVSSVPLPSLELPTNNIGSKILTSLALFRQRT